MSQTLHYWVEKAEIDSGWLLPSVPTNMVGRRAIAW